MAPPKDCRPDQEREEHEARNHRWQRLRQEQRADPCCEIRGEARAGAFHADERQQQAQEAGEDGCRQQGERQNQHEAGGKRGVRGGTQRRTPAIELPRGPILPHAGRIPQPGAAVDGGEESGQGPGSTACDEVDLHAGFVERAQDAGMIRAGGTRSRQHDRRAQPGRVRALGQIRRDHACAPSSSCRVTSFTISNRRDPFGVDTFTSSPSSLFTSARPMGEAVEIIPCSGSASSGITSW